MFCDVTDDAIIGAEDISPVYAIPMNFKQQKLDQTVLNMLRIEAPPGDLSEWQTMLDALANAETEVKIACVGKYTGHDDAYKSINEAFIHAGIANRCKVRLTWVDSEQFENGVLPAEKLKDYEGVLIGPGFGSRGIEGKIKTVRYVRESGTPFFGICLGMQVAVIELARAKLGLSRANSTEFDPETPDAVISLLSEQRNIKDLGGTMRLGKYRCQLTPGTHAHAAYACDVIEERHRHRYEFNNDYRDRLEKAGLVVSGVHAMGEHELVEIAELKDHPWFCGSQFHPEFKSTPLNPQPLFREFIRAVLAQRKSRG
jgi:CTP synthase